MSSYLPYAGWASTQDSDSLDAASTHAGAAVVEGYCRPVEKFTSLNLTSRPEVVEVFGKAYTCRLPPHVAERMASSCEKVLKAGGYNARIEREVLAEGDASCALDPGAGICVVARCGEGVLLGVDELGERGVPR
jgi:RNA 3'-terminal phosphate cyclase